MQVFLNKNNNLKSILSTCNELERMWFHTDLSIEDITENAETSAIWSNVLRAL